MSFRWAGGARNVFSGVAAAASLVFLTTLLGGCGTSQPVTTADQLSAQPPGRGVIIGSILVTALPVPPSALLSPIRLQPVASDFDYRLVGTDGLEVDTKLDETTYFAVTATAGPQHLKNLEFRGASLGGPYYLGLGSFHFCVPDRGTTYVGSMKITLPGRIIGMPFIRNGSESKVELTNAYEDVVQHVSTQLGQPLTNVDTRLLSVGETGCGSEPVPSTAESTITQMGIPSPVGR